MARGNITFIKGTGASGRTAAGKDYISGLLLYNDTLPSGFSSTERIKKFFSLVDAENAGITTAGTDETKATGKILIEDSMVSEGTPYPVYVLNPLTGETIDLTGGGQLQGDEGETSLSIANAIKTAINARTYIHGFTAANTTAEITLTAASGFGVTLNTGTPITITNIGGGIPDITATITQFSGGAGSKISNYHYHISEFFRANPSGQLYVGIFDVPTTYTFAEITDIQNFAGGEIRQIGVFKDETYSNADIIAIQSEVETHCDAMHKPLSILYAGNLKATADITTVPDLGALSSFKVSSIIGQDGAGLGSQLYLTYGASITQLGIALGMLSKSAVSEDFGQPVTKFNLSNGTENDVPAFANGQLVKSLSETALDAIDTNRHIFGQNYVGVSGTYFNDNHTAISTTSDYAYINDNRVIDKAIRGVYTALIPYLKSKLIKNADGTLADSTVAYLESVAIQPLYQMSREQDLGAVSEEDVYIDPSQNVNNGTLIINIKLNENGIARNIVIPISFK